MRRELDRVAGADLTPSGPAIRQEEHVELPALERPRDLLPVLDLVPVVADLLGRVDPGELRVGRRRVEHEAGEVELLRGHAPCRCFRRLLVNAATRSCGSPVRLMCVASSGSDTKSSAIPCKA